MAADRVTRVAADLMEAASVEGQRSSRSAKQQLDYWARLGRALEAGNIDRRGIDRVLEGAAPYSSLEDREQAVVRSAWETRIDETLARLNFAEEFAATGDEWVIGDGHGGAVVKSSAGKAGRSRDAG